MENLPRPQVLVKPVKAVLALAAEITTQLHQDKHIHHSGVIATIRVESNRRHNSPTETSALMPSSCVLACGPPHDQRGRNICPRQAGPRSDLAGLAIDHEPSRVAFPGHCSQHRLWDHSQDNVDFHDKVWARVVYSDSIDELDLVIECHCLPLALQASLSPCM